MTLNVVVSGKLDTRPTLDDLMSGTQMSQSLEVASAGKDSLVEATMGAQSPDQAKVK